MEQKLNPLPPKILPFLGNPPSFLQEFLNPPPCSKFLKILSPFCKGGKGEVGGEYYHACKRTTKTNENVQKKPARFGISNSQGTQNKKTVTQSCATETAILQETSSKL